MQNYRLCINACMHMAPRARTRGKAFTNCVPRGLLLLAARACSVPRPPLGFPARYGAHQADRPPPACHQTRANAPCLALRRNSLGTLPWLPPPLIPPVRCPPSPRRGPPQMLRGLGRKTVAATPTCETPRHRPLSKIASYAWAYTRGEMVNECEDIPEPDMGVDMKAGNT